jgi:hypothetical protein
MGGENTAIHLTRDFIEIISSHRVWKGCLKQLSYSGILNSYVEESKLLSFIVWTSVQIRSDLISMEISSKKTSTSLKLICVPFFGAIYQIYQILLPVISLDSGWFILPLRLLQHHSGCTCWACSHSPSPLEVGKVLSEKDKVGRFFNSFVKKIWNLKFIELIELYLCTLDLWALISPELMDLRPKGAGFIKVMYWSKRSLVHLVWAWVVKE